MMGSPRIVIAYPPPTPEAQISDAYDQFADAIFRHCYFRLFNRERAKELSSEALLQLDAGDAGAALETSGVALQKAEEASAKQ